MSNSKRSESRILLALILSIVIIVILGYCHDIALQNGKVRGNERLLVVNGVKSRDCPSICHYEDTYFYIEDDNVIRLDSNGKKTVVYSSDASTSIRTICYNSNSFYLAHSEAFSDLVMMEKSWLRSKGMEEPFSTGY